MYTFNGIGSMLYGKYQKESDGSFIATIWLVLVFVPLWPFAAYLVLRNPEGEGWLFLARAPLPPLARGARVATAAAVLTAMIAAYAISRSAATHTDVFAYNGFDRPVVAYVGDSERVVPAHRHEVFEGVSLDSTRFSASWKDEAGPFESFQVDLSGHGDETIVYNVGDQAVLWVDYVVYGEGTPREGHTLVEGPVIFLGEEIDYPFTTPPDSKYVYGSGIENSVLHAVGAGLSALGTVSLGTPILSSAAALAAARAELQAHPENVQLAYMTASALLFDDPDEAVEVIRSCRERLPDDVHLHRMYQEIWLKARRTYPIEEYRSLLAANPKSPMYHYLLGRMIEQGSGGAADHYQAALELDPEYPPAHRALGHVAATGGRWTDALEHFDRFASLGSQEALEAIEPRLRLYRRLNREPRELNRLLDEARDLHPDVMYLELLQGHHRLETGASTLAEELVKIAHKVENSLLAEWSDAMAGNVRADLALTVGDLELARGELTRLKGEDRAPSVALRLALSAGATREDLELLGRIPAWMAQLDQAEQLMALEFLGWIDREKALQTWFGANVAAIARLLETPDGLVDADSLIQQVSQEYLGAQVAAYVAAARKLADETSPEAVRARRAYIEEARSLALPGELPWLGNVEGGR
jgi:tetratricopeptide (TPR) repeat protein